MKEKSKEPLRMTEAIHLTDMQYKDANPVHTVQRIKDILNANGIVGISLCPEHLTTNPVANIDDILRHIDHYLSLGGENNIALGCDFDGVSTLPTQIHDISSLTVLYERLLKQYNETITNKIFRRNSCDLMKRIFI
jgi:membrane dipeptidase